MPHVCCRFKLILAGVVLAAAGWLVLSPSNPTLAQTPAADAKPAVCMARYTGSKNDPKANPPQRWDDIIWENDRIAHRIYGPQLAQPAPNGEGLVTSGIDVWVKRTRELFMDKQLASADQHNDSLNMGRDCYDVQQTCGAGGLGVYDISGKKLMRSGNWETCGGFVNGPDIASFWVTYAPWDIGGGAKVKEKRTFTLPAGTNFTRMVSTIDDLSAEPGQARERPVGIGIAKRKADGKRFSGEDKWVANKEKGVFVYWEPDQTYGTPAAAGHTGVAVLVDPKSLITVLEDPVQYLIIVKVISGKPWVYNAGACWSLGLDFKTQPEWEKYATTFKSNFDPDYKYTPQSFQ